MSEFGDIGKAHDRITSNSPKLEQATKIQKPVKNGSLLAKLRAFGLASAVAVGTSASVGAALEYHDQTSPPDQSITDLYKKGQISGIDTTSYLVRAQIEGKGDLRIRMSPSNTDTYFDLEKVDNVNGTKWDGKIPIVLKNTPYEMGADPSDGIGQSPWLIVNLETSTLAGNKVKTIGFINVSSATQDHISKLKEGKIAEPKLDSNNNLIGVLNSGKEIAPERMSQARPYIPAPETSPQG